MAAINLIEFALQKFSMCTTHMRIAKGGFHSDEENLRMDENGKVMCEREKL